MSEIDLNRQLFQRLKEGDQDAVAYAVKSELPRVYNLCVRLCRNVSEAEDLCQDVFIRALKGFEHFDGKSKLSTWLYTVTLNTWKNRVRSEKRRHKEAHISLDNNDDHEGRVVMEIPEPDLKPDQVCESRELYGQVYLALDQLDDESRGIIIFRDVDDLTYEEIGEIMKLPMGTVKSKLSRAREALRTIWKNMQ